jgi:hypothetical protein
LSGIEVPLHYYVAAATYPKTWQLGARGRVVALHGWDFSLSGYSGVEKSARFYLAKKGDATTPDTPIVVTVNPSFHRETMVGFDGSTSFGQVAARFELAYRMPDNSRLKGASPEVEAALRRKNYFYGTFGADYLTPEFWGVTHWINAGFVLRTESSEQNQQPQSILSNFGSTDPFNRNLMLHLENRFTTKTKLATVLSWSLKDNDGFVNPALQVAWNDQFKTMLGAEIFFGRSSGFFGQFSDNRRLNLSATVEF